MASIQIWQIQIMKRNVKGGVVDWSTGYMMLDIFTIHAFWLAYLNQGRWTQLVRHDCGWVLITKMKSSVTLLSLKSRSNKLVTGNTVICGSFSKKKSNDIFSSAFELGLIWISCCKCRTIKTISDSSSIYLIITY